MKHKYLEEQGITAYADNDWGANKNIFCNLRRKIKFFFRKQKTGVDPRTCYDLDTELMFWLYEHICQFIDDADKVIDLEWYKIIFEDKEYTLKALLVLLKENILKYIKADEEEDPFNFKEIDKRENEYADKVFDILKVVRPYLWW